MPHPALAVWKETRGSATLHVVSSFFTAITCKLTGGRESSHISEGDVVLRDYSALIEVKGVGSDHPYRLDRTQIERHAQRVQTFPFDDARCYFFLFGYSTRESRTAAMNGTRRSLIRSEAVNGTGYRFLAERTLKLWILPLSTIQELSEHRERPDRLLFPAMRDGEPSWGLSLTRTNLQRFEREIPTRCGTVDLTFRVNGSGNFHSAFHVIRFNPDDAFGLPLKGVVWD